MKTTPKEEVYRITVKAVPREDGSPPSFCVLGDNGNYSGKGQCTPVIIKQERILPSQDDTK